MDGADVRGRSGRYEVGDVKTPREIAHDAALVRGSIECAFTHFDIEDMEYSARAGMIEALRAVLNKGSSCDEYECYGHCAFELALTKLLELKKS
jgi:hypothetical protein